MSKLSSKQTLGFTLHNLTYKDLKRECISRNMPFEQVAMGDFPTLNNWLNHNMVKPKDEALISKYDDWVDEILIARGKPDLVHTSLRLSYIGTKIETEDGEEKPTKAKTKEETKPKRKREKTEEGIFKGTKKAMVWEMVARGRSLEKTVARVMKKYPDAKEKSIKIWYNKRKREIGK